MTPIPIVDVSGSPREMGRSHGEQRREQIAQVLGMAIEPLAARWGVTRAGLHERLRVFLPMFRQAAPRLIDEMQGIAEGAAQPFDEIFFLNARHGGVTALECRQSSEEGCTSFAVGPGSTATGKVLIGQNKDSGLGALEQFYLLRTRPDHGPRVLALTYPGEVGHLGIGSGGVALFGNALYGPEKTLGAPHNLMRRPMLECSSVDEMETYLETFNAWTSANFLVADRSGTVTNFEILAGKVRKLASPDGVIAHGNHVEHPDHAANERFPDRAEQSEPRTRRLRQRLEETRGEVTAADCMRALADHTHSPQSVCRHDAPIQTGTSMWTTCSLVADLDSMVLHVCLGNPCEGTFSAHGFE